MYINGAHLYPVTKEAAKWRDVDVKWQNVELAIKIACVVGIIIILVGMALGFYYSATTTETVVDQVTGKAFELSNAVFCVFPAVFGTVAVVGLVAGFILSSYFDSRNGREEDLSKISAHNALVTLLTGGEISGIYNKYYQKNGGLKLLVRKGYMLPEQANKVRELLQEYHEKKTVMDCYEQQFFAKRAIDANRLPEEYYQARKRAEELNGAWLEISSAIAEHYQDGIKIELQPISVQANQITEQGPVTPIPPTKLMQPDAKALKWRDLDVIEQHKELAIKVALVTGIILVLIGIAISCYFFATTSHTPIKVSGQVIEQSNAIFCICPATIGSFAIFCMVFGLVFTNFEERHGLREDLTKPHMRDERLLMFTEGTLDEVYRQCYKKHGGLTQFVRKGYLTAAQGDQLREMFKEFDENKKALKTYMSNFTGFMLDIHEHPEKSSALTYLLRSRKKLEQRWQKLRDDIRANGTPFTGQNERETPLNTMKMGRSLWKNVKGRVKEYVYSYLPSQEPEEVEMQDILASLPFLPNEMIQHIFSFLPVSDLNNVGRIQNGHLQDNVAYALANRGREYGTDSLEEHFDAVVTLSSRGYIPKKCIVHQPGLFFRSIDGEATLRKMRAIPVEERELLQGKLGIALVEYAQKGNIAIVEALLTLGADLERRDETGATPLIIAAAKENKKIVELLIKHGADTNALDYNGQSPLSHAAQFNAYTEVARLLLQNNAAMSINHVSKQGYAPLHFAARKYQFAATELQKEMVWLLLQFGAEKSLRNHRGQTALDLARSNTVRLMIASF